MTTSGRPAPSEVAGGLLIGGRLGEHGQIRGGPAQALLEAHPELLSDHADSAFDILIQMSKAQQAPDVVQMLEIHLKVLKLCRQVGIAEAFRQVKDATTTTIPEDEMLAYIIQNTVAVMSGIPQNRDDWLNVLSSTCQMVEETGNEGLTGLLKAVHRLVSGERATAINPRLPAKYRDVWLTILEWLEGGQPAQTRGVDMFEMLSQGTLSALASSSEQLAAWTDHIRNLLRQADDLNDQPLAALLDAIAHLLDGSPPDTITPAVEGEYMACWQQILAGEA